MSEYDSTEDTKSHIARVQQLLGGCSVHLHVRAKQHDKSKLEEPEKSTFDYATPRLAGSTYGSEEYKGFLAELKPALDHHYAANSHHPEHYPWHCPVCDSSFTPEQAPEWPNTAGVDGEIHRFCPKCCPASLIWECELDYKPDKGVSGMSLLDVLEMLCDWKAAGERHNNGSIQKSLEINQKRFHIGVQLQRILENTAKEMGWME